MKSTETILAEIQKDIQHFRENQDKGFKHIEEQQSNMIESYNGKFLMVDNRITKGEGHTDDLCKRMREAEKVQAVRISTMTKVIAALAIGATLFCERIWHFIIS